MSDELLSGDIYREKHTVKLRFEDGSSGGGFTLLDEGDHPAVVSDLDTEATSSAGNSMYVVEFKVDSEKFRNVTAKYWIPILKATMWKAREFVEALGVPVVEVTLEDGSKVWDADFEPEEQIGKPVTIRVKHDHYDKPQIDRETEKPIILTSRTPLKWGDGSDVTDPAGSVVYQEAGEQKKTRLKNHKITKVLPAAPGQEMSGLV